MNATRDEKYPFSLSMLGWGLNEEESIEEYVDRAGNLLARYVDDFELVLLDDGSTDRTWEIMQECAATRPWLKCYQNDGNKGPGYSTKRAISLATKDYVFWQTVDWAYDISLMCENLHLLEEYDVLQGVRAETLSLSGLTRRSDNSRKAIISITNYLLSRTLFRLPLSDYQNVTVYPRELIQSCVLESESSFTNPECLLKTWWKGARFAEVPVPFVKRQKGEAKGTRWGQLYAAIRDIMTWWTRWMLMGRRPDKGRGTVTQWDDIPLESRITTIPIGTPADAPAEDVESPAAA